MLWLEEMFQEMKKVYNKKKKREKKIKFISVARQTDL